MILIAYYYFNSFLNDLVNTKYNRKLNFFLKCIYIKIKMDNKQNLPPYLENIKQFCFSNELEEKIEPIENFNEFSLYQIEDYIYYTINTDIKFKKNEYSNEDISNAAIILKYGNTEEYIKEQNRILKKRKQNTEAVRRYREKQKRMKLNL